jgi:hypothetical protein
MLREYLYSVKDLGCDKAPHGFTARKGEKAWGRGWVIEDVWMDRKEDPELPPDRRYEAWEPHIQAIKNERGDLALRFCFWKRNPDGSKGAFVRAPMLIFDWTIEDLREEAKKCRAEIILMLLKKFAE